MQSVAIVQSPSLLLSTTKQHLPHLNSSPASCLEVDRTSFVLGEWKGRSHSCRLVEPPAIGKFHIRNGAQHQGKAGRLNTQVSRANKVSAAGDDRIL